MAHESAPPPEDVTPRPGARQPETKPLPKGPRQGYTAWAETPIGKVHVTLTVDPAQPWAPFDVFISLSKAGTDSNADVDALARLLSLLVRLDSNISPRRRLELAIEQLQGIAGLSSVGEGAERVASVPAGIAIALGELLELLEPDPQLGLFEESGRP